jgi:2-polyprenyl-3-methyl-5-hydroxy-6-metoxy-1,4-benzoquinol methylase
MDRSAYDGYFELDQKHFWRVGKRRLVLASIASQIEPAQPLKIMDIGGCCSVITKSLEAFGDVQCVEPDESMVALASELQGVNVVHGMLPDDLPDGGPFDLVTLLDVLEHVDEDGPSLASIFRILKPGGWILCTVPAYMWLWSDHDRSVHHKRRYTRSRLGTLMGEAGFQVSRITHYTSLLLPLVAAERLIKRLKTKPDENVSYDVKVPPRWMNGILGGVMGIERGLLRYADFPFGSSILAVGRRPVE